MSDQATNDEILDRWSEFARPADGQQYRHYKGGEYEVAATGFLEDSLTPCVVYRSLETGIVWVRSADDFLGVVTLENGQQPRFQLM